MQMYFLFGHTHTSWNRARGEIGEMVSFLPRISLATGRSLFSAIGHQRGRGRGREGRLVARVGETSRHPRQIQRPRMRRCEARNNRWMPSTCHRDPIDRVSRRWPNNGTRRVLLPRRTMTGSCARFDSREKVEKGAERLGPDREKNAASAILCLQCLSKRS